MVLFSMVCQNRVWLWYASYVLWNTIAVVRKLLKLESLDDLILGGLIDQYLPYSQSIDIPYRWSRTGSRTRWRSCRGTRDPCGSWAGPIPASTRSSRLRGMISEWLVWIMKRNCGGLQVLIFFAAKCAIYCLQGISERVYAICKTQIWW